MISLIVDTIFLTHISTRNSRNYTRRAKIYLIRRSSTLRVQRQRKQTTEHHHRLLGSPYPFINNASFMPPTVAGRTFERNAVARHPHPLSTIHLRLLASGTPHSIKFKCVHLSSVSSCLFESFSKNYALELPFEGRPPSRGRPNLGSIGYLISRFSIHRLQTTYYTRPLAMA